MQTLKIKFEINKFCSKSLAMFTRKDVIFVLKEATIENKKTMVENVVKLLKKGGYLFIGHSETLNQITNVVRQVRPTIYIKD